MALFHLFDVNNDCRSQRLSNTLALIIFRYAIVKFGCPKFGTNNNFGKRVIDNGGNRTNQAKNGWLASVDYRLRRGQLGKIVQELYPKLKKWTIDHVGMSFSLAALIF